MKIGVAVATVALLAASSGPGTAEPLRLVGATTFTAEVMVPHQAEIEAISGHCRTDLVLESMACSRVTTSQ